MNKLGILLRDFGHSQVAQDAIDSLNVFMADSSRPHYDIVFFYENFVPTQQTPLTAMMNIYSTWGYDGPIVACCLSGIEKIMIRPGIVDNYFYMYDFEWIHNPYLFDRYVKVMQSGVKVISRSEEHSKLIRNNFNVNPLFVMNQMDVGELCQRIK